MLSPMRLLLLQQARPMHLLLLQQALRRSQWTLRPLMVLAQLLHAQLVPVLVPVAQQVQPHPQVPRAPVVMSIQQLASAHHPHQHVVRILGVISTHSIFMAGAGE